MSSCDLVEGECKLTSGQNPHVKQVIKLRERRERERSQGFLIEGYRELVCAVRSRVSLVTLFFSPPHFLGTNEPQVMRDARAQGAKLFEVSPEVFRKMSYRDRPDGLLAIARQGHRVLSELALLAGLDGPPQKKKPPFFVVAEAIEKPGNLGTILRSCDAAAIDALIVCDRCTDLFNPNVVRASVGTLFTVPTIEAGSEETIQWLKAQGVKIVATSPTAPTLFTQAPLSGPIAIVVGTEQLGLSKRWLEKADLLVRIPMYGMADSLNVATATTLLLYEALRQRV